jgi:hypothetical protein
VAPIGIFPLLLTLSLLSQTTRSIEKAFFQDDPGLLYSLLTTQGHVYISLPEPLSFSDQISPQQAFFFFRQVYASYSTFEFYADSELPVLAKEKSFIFKARWSFKNKKSDNQYVFQVFFHLTRERPPNVRNRQIPWRITEIKAESL